MQLQNKNLSKGYSKKSPTDRVKNKILGTFDSWLAEDKIVLV